MATVSPRRPLYLLSTSLLHPALFLYRLLVCQLVNPKPFLADLVGKNVVVKLKWGMEYKGKLASVDSYMNFQVRGHSAVASSWPARQSCFRTS
jgi:hypothetical protein